MWSLASLLALPQANKLQVTNQAPQAQIILLEIFVNKVPANTETA
jgi:hypothetical protein